jgi:alkylation response protein AidB-like acyl-CoA dehydrogenase
VRSPAGAVHPGIIDGSTLGAFAYLERQSRYELSDVATRATADGDGYVLNGEKVAVQQRRQRRSR